MQLHQVLVGAGPHDAITSMARNLRGVLRRCGESEIFAENRQPGVPDVRALSEFPGADPDHGVLVFHASYGDPAVFRFLMGRPERIVLVFHHLSPAAHFERTEPERAAMLLWGWRELELLRPRVALSIADSTFNARSLEAVGYRDVRTIPAGVDPERLLRTSPDPSAMATMGRYAGDPLVVYVGQVLAHKRIDVLLHAQMLLDRMGTTSTLAVAGTPTDPLLARALAELARDLAIPRCAMLGPLGDDALAAVLRNADVLVTASEHEGLCLPVLEAMAMGVPVVARAHGALPETIGDAGLVLPADAGAAELAEAVALVHDEPALAAELAARGRRRAAAVSLDRNLAAFLDALSEVV